MGLLRPLFKSGLTIRIGINVIICLTLLQSIGRANAPMPRPRPSKILPSEIGSFHLIGDAIEIDSGNEKEAPGTDALKSMVGGYYETGDGAHLRVTLFKWETDSAAYSSLTTLRQGKGSNSDSPTETVGTVSALTDDGIVFFKGPTSVQIISVNDTQRGRAVELARLLAPTLESGEGEIPVLVKHLPNWEVAQRQAVYAVTSDLLTRAVPNQPILGEIGFAGGTEAVVAKYGQSQLLVVEFTTPQFSIDNDQRIWTKIDELKKKGDPVPTAYRRVGNYSVFVFNAPDEKTANALIDQVKYEQVVQWLGDDPHLYERLQRYFAQTSAGVFVAVLKSSGLSLLFCLAAGALIGTMLFRRRRAQRAAAYSDAGGSVRLNLDDLTGPIASRHLLPTKQPDQDSR
jgi:Family of unknown function (DUF6599)